MSATERYLRCHVFDRATCAIVADMCYDEGRDEEAAAFRGLWPELESLCQVRVELREYLVDPQCLRVVPFSGTAHWCLYVALPGHPSPGNAGRGFSYPAYAVPPESQRKVPALSRLLRKCTRDSQLPAQLTRWWGFRLFSIGQNRDGSEILWVDFEGDTSDYEGIRPGNRYRVGPSSV